MSEYEIGRDLQELRTRVERLEGKPARFNERSVKAGTLVSGQANIHPAKKPILWSQRKGVEFPPFINGFFRFPPHIKLSGAQSQTWSIQPEPLILSVNWSGGGSDELCRLSDQMFSLIRFMDPNTGIVSAYFSYSAQLKASGKGYSAHLTNGVPFPDNTMNMSIELKNAAVGVVASFESFPFGVKCSDDKSILNMHSFNPGLYDLITNFYFTITGPMIWPC